MSTKKISELETTSAVSTSDLMETAIPSGSSYASKKMSIAQLATYLENSVVHSALDTTNKTIIDAINELKSICDNLSASHFIVANQLPTSDINMNAIYLIPKQSTGVNDVYEEYICLDDTTTPATWEKIGETQIDLSNYITFDDADIATTSKNGSMSKADRSKMNGIESGAQKNVQSDWNASSGDAFIKHKPTIPDELADLTDDSTHRLVTDTEKNTWNNERAISKELTNESLDSITEPGFYYAGSGNTCRNKPSGVYNFGMIVLKTNTWGYSSVRQILIADNLAYGMEREKDGYDYWTDWYTCEGRTVDQSVIQDITDYAYPLLASPTPDNGEEITDEINAVKKTAGMFWHSIFKELEVREGSISAQTYNFNLFGTPNGSLSNLYGSDVSLPNHDGTLTTEKNAVLWKQQNLLGAKNLLPYNPYNPNGYVQNGITFTVTEEGYVIANGTKTTASNNSTFNISERYENTGLFLPNGTYILSGCPSGGSTTTYQIGVAYQNSSGTYTNFGFDYGEGVEFTVNGSQYSDKGAWTRVFVVLRGGYATANNLTFKPMIRLASISDSTYESPSNTNRQLTLSKLSWEENKASGVKNYINYPYNHPMQGETYTIRDVEYTDNGDGGIVANGTCDNTGNSYCQVLKTTSTSAGLHFCKLPKGRYHFSGGISDDYYMNLSRGLISNPSATRTEIGTDYGDGFDFDVTEQQANESYFCLFCFVAKNKTATNVVFYPMITRYEDSSQGYAEYAMTNAELTQFKADMDNIAPTETSGVSAHAYAVGDYMWWRHGFYRVTQAIAVGDSITTSKVTKTTLGAELKRALT